MSRGARGSTFSDLVSPLLERPLGRSSHDPLQFSVSQICSYQNPRCARGRALPGDRLVAPRFIPMTGNRNAAPGSSAVEASCPQSLAPAPAGCRTVAVVDAVIARWLLRSGAAVHPIGRVHSALIPLPGAQAAEVVGRSCSVVSPRGTFAPIWSDRQRPFVPASSAFRLLILCPQGDGQSDTIKENEGIPARQCRDSVEPVTDGVHMQEQLGSAARNGSVMG